MKKLLVLTVLALVGSIIWTSFALAEPLNPADPTDVLAALADAFAGSKWLLVAALGGVLLVWALRKVAGFASKVSWLSWSAWFLTDRGGAILGFSTGFLTSIATALMAGISVNWIAAIEAGILMLGIYSGVKKTAAPSDKKAA